MRYELKTPCRDGATHILFESLDLIAKLAALAPKPRVNLTRFHCVFAPNSKHRVQVTPVGRVKAARQNHRMGHKIGPPSSSGQPSPGRNACSEFSIERQ